jgi:hypothetical protein
LDTSNAVKYTNHCTVRVAFVIQRLDRNKVINNLIMMR